MDANGILSQLKIARNGQAQFPPSFVPQVRATTHLISTSGFFILKGTTGRILEYTPAGGVIVDFGYLSVFFIPAGSSIIETVGGR